MSGPIRNLALPTSVPALLAWVSFVRAAFVRVVLVSACLVALSPGSGRAGEADVLTAEASCSPAPGGRAASICSFTVGVRHGDTAWDHFANRWDIIGSDGNVLAARQLEHPHVEEQPVRRSLGRVRIPRETKSVTIRANDSMHGLGGAELTIDVPHAAARSESEAAPLPAP